MISEAEISGRKAFITMAVVAATPNTPIFVPPSTGGKYAVKSASARWHTASSSGKLQLEVAGAGVAIGSGVNQLDTSLDTSLTADTTVTQKASTPTIFGSESSLNLIVSGTMTGLVGGTITIELEKQN